MERFVIVNQAQTNTDTPQIQSKSTKSEFVKILKSYEGEQWIKTCSETTRLVAESINKDLNFTVKAHLLISLIWRYAMFVLSSIVTKRQ